MEGFDIEAVMEIEHRFGKGSKKPVDNSAPKRPLSAYFLWANKVRASVVEKNSGASIVEIAKLLGKKWKKTSSSERAIFEKSAEKEKKVYMAKMEKYKKTSQYRNFRKSMVAWKIHETKKPFPKDPNAPKRSPSAYLLYGASVRDSIIEENPDLTITEVMKEQSVWWNALSDKDRKPWVEKAEVEKAKYQKKFARYMKTSDYQTWVTGRDEYKKMMLDRRNKIMGIKKRARSESKPKSAKKKKSSSKRKSRTPKASKKKRSSSNKSSKRRSRTPKAPKKSSRSSSRRSARRRSTRKSRTASRSKSRRSSKRRSSKRSSRRTKNKKSRSKSAGRRRSKSASKKAVEAATSE